MVDRMMHDRIRRLTLDGHTAADIARELGCSTRTVERVRDPKPRTTAEKRARPTGRKAYDSERLAGAAAKLLDTPALGDKGFREAVAQWLYQSAEVTGRLEREAKARAFPTLPCVMAVVERIEAAS